MVISYGFAVSLNPERMRALLRDLENEDPDADVRRQLISGRPQGDLALARAVTLLSSHLLRDPYELMTGVPPSWLVELSRTPAGAPLLFDSRLTELARRAVDDLRSQGCNPDQLISWLEDQRRIASPSTRG